MQNMHNYRPVTFVPPEQELEAQIDHTIANLREKQPYQMPTGSLIHLIGSGEPVFADAAFTWPALTEIVETLTTYKIPRDINVPAQVPLTAPQMEALRLLAAMRLLSIHGELARGAWTTEAERNSLVLERQSAFRVYKTLEGLTPVTSAAFSGR